MWRTASKMSWCRYAWTRCFRVTVGTRTSADMQAPTDAEPRCVAADDLVTDSLNLSIARGETRQMCDTRSQLRHQTCNCQSVVPNACECSHMGGLTQAIVSCLPM